MRVVFVNCAHAPHLTEPETLLDEYRSLTGWAEGTAGAGAEAVVVQGFLRDADVERNGIRYLFVAGPFSPSLAVWRHSRRLSRAVAALCPDAVHLNGLIYPLQCRSLRRALPAPCPLVVQHHAERPFEGVAGRIQRWGLRAADAFLFTGREMADHWLERSTLDPSTPIYEIVEGSSHFRLTDRDRARALTGMEGDPVLLWVGNLNPRKDPLTVLDGFALVVGRHPRARLYMLYLDSPLLEQVEERLASSDTLRTTVTLLGGRPYGELEPFFNSADLFVLGSHAEGSGYALLDAMACGLVPVVTDIPSFRYITDGGRLGSLWRPGEPTDMAEAVSRAVAVRQPSTRHHVRSYFDDELSFEAIGRRAIEAYAELRRGR